MPRRSKLERSGVKTAIIFVTLSFFWYKVLPVFIGAMKLDTQAMIAILLAFITQFLIGEKILRWLR